MEKIKIDELEKLLKQMEIQFAVEKLEAGEYEVYVNEVDWEVFLRMIPPGLKQEIELRGIDESILIRHPFRFLDATSSTTVDLALSNIEVATEFSKDIRNCREEIKVNLISASKKIEGMEKDELRELCLKMLDIIASKIYGE